MDAPIVPFRQFVLKVASRCDLACDHCYVYEHADQSWRGRPMVMPDDTVARVAGRIAEHATRHGLGVVHVVMHGGEPLLAGPRRIEELSRTLRRALDGVAELDLRIHTNGVLLTETFCRMFEAENIKVGISLDGDRVANDRHRVYANGRSSYDQATKAIKLLRDRYRGLYAGLLCTMDVRNDPIAVYEALVALEPPRIDFLLPHATWDQRPLRFAPDDTAYADWLITIHDRWVADGRPVAIRMFDSIVLTARGGDSQTESLGLGPSDLVVIETDGSYEQADSLKTAFDGAPATGYDVFRHSLDEVAGHPGISARQGGAAALAAECRACPLVESCGGGLYAHRYRTGSGFHNPSVYCADLFKLISHVRRASGVVPHTLSSSTLDVLATATVGPSEIAELQAPQRSLVRRMVAQAAQGQAGLAGSDPAWAVLTRLDRENRAAVDEVFSHPYVRAWATRCGDSTKGDTTGAASGRIGDVRFLASIAATVAIRARRPSRVVVPIQDGMVCLPGLGRMRVGGEEVALEDSPLEGSALVEVTGDSFAVEAGGHRYGEDDPAWESVRVLEGEGVRLLLDDIDPHRDCYGAPVRERLTEQQAAVWQRYFAAAWTVLARARPSLAAAMRAGLRVVTPLAVDAGRGLSARSAYGALALSECAEPDTLAMLLVREFMRAQLGAMLDMFDLTGGDPSVEGRLSDAYGRLAALDFMDSGLEPGLDSVMNSDEMDATLLRIRGILGSLRGLPAVGQRFADGMRAASIGRGVAKEPCALIPAGQNRDDATRTPRDM